MARTRILLCILMTIAFGDFIFRAVLPSYANFKNDFSDPYLASGLWRHGENPYDVQLATRANHDLAGDDSAIVPVYPPSAYLLVAPLSFLPWKLANLLWSVAGLLSVVMSAYLLPRMAGLSFKGNMAWLLAACVVSAAPMHTALHVGNSSAIVFGMCVFAIYLARREQDLAAGLLIALTACLKPQLGIWVFLFYVLRRRWRIVLPAGCMGLSVLALSLLRLEHPASFLHDYSVNLQYWFGPGRMNDFSYANPFRFELLNAQVGLYAVLHNSVWSNGLAWALFVALFIAWLRWAWFSQANEMLGLASLLALGLLPVYHRSYDAVIALFSLCWFVQARNRRYGILPAALASVLLLLPTQSVIVRLMPHLPASALSAWWWNLAVAALGSWIVLLLSFSLLYALRCSTQAIADREMRKAGSFSVANLDAVPSHS